ncbi:hypothetical protein AWQ24_03140 [Picosynechococcus sp. PCC 8807]|nr:hypothetical protein AWQ24_03140 [Picosynechococcus sp. PCC 8807]
MWLPLSQQGPQEKTSEAIAGMTQACCCFCIEKIQDFKPRVPSTKPEIFLYTTLSVAEHTIFDQGIFQLFAIFSLSLGHVT